MLSREFERARMIASELEMQAQTTPQALVYFKEIIERMYGKEMLDKLPKKLLCALAGISMTMEMSRQQHKIDTDTFMMGFDVLVLLSIRAKDIYENESWDDVKIPDKI